MEGQFGVKTVEWDMGLPSLEDLTPLTQSLISPELALAFGITQERPRVLFDLNRASQDTCSMICPKESNVEGLRLFPGGNDSDRSSLKRVDSCGPDESYSGSKEENGDENGLNRAVKRPRLVWTPQLHKRFVDVIEHLGIEKAVPKTIMEMMNVEGLTRENVASHLQKYRLYLKRMEGLANEGHPVPRRPPTLFECDGFGPVPPQPQLQHQSLHCDSLPLMPMPMVGPPTGAYGFGHLGLPVGHSNPPGYCGLESANMFWNRHRG